MQKQTVLILGAGIGGKTTAARLAKNIRHTFRRRFHTPWHWPAHRPAFGSLNSEPIIKEMGTISVQNLAKAALAAAD